MFCLVVDGCCLLIGTKIGWDDDKIKKCNSSSNANYFSILLWLGLLMLLHESLVRYFSAIENERGEKVIAGNKL